MQNFQNWSSIHTFFQIEKLFFVQITQLLGPYGSTVHGEEEIESVGKVLITGEHVLNPIIIELRKIRWLTNFEWLKNSKHCRFKPGSWNTPDEFSGEHNRTKKEIFIIGGGKVYEYALERNLVDIIYLTRIHAQIQGDIFFPTIDMKMWKKLEESFHEKDTQHKYSFTFFKFEKSS